ncbi:hypothetical protein DAI22_02g296300 [Oryza sativa Japonica Group]|nr:hypothetical protein DAI22_02g296300 [Oryza sativa Japonica Group]
MKTTVASKITHRIISPQPPRPKPPQTGTHIPLPSLPPDPHRRIRGRRHRSESPAATPRERCPGSYRGRRQARRSALRAERAEETRPQRRSGERSRSRVDEEEEEGSSGETRRGEERRRGREKKCG